MWQKKHINHRLNSNGSTPSLTMKFLLDDLSIVLVVMWCIIFVYITFMMVIIPFFHHDFSLNWRTMYVFCECKDESFYHQNWWNRCIITWNTFCCVRKFRHVGVCLEWHVMPQTWLFVTSTKTWWINLHFRWILLRDVNQRFFSPVTVHVIVIWWLCMIKSTIPLFFRHFTFSFHHFINRNPRRMKFYIKRHE